MEIFIFMYETNCKKKKEKYSINRSPPQPRKILSAYFLSENKSLKKGNSSESTKPAHIRPSQSETPIRRQYYALRRTVGLESGCRPPTIVRRPTIRILRWCHRLCCSTSDCGCTFSNTLEPKMLI